MDPQFLSFEDDPRFELAVRAGVERNGKAGPQYLANFFGSKRETGVPIPLIDFGIQTTDPEKVKVDGVLDKILTGAREAPAQLGSGPALHVPDNNFKQLAGHDE